MKTGCLAAVLTALLLSACAGGVHGGGNTQMYGEVKGGVESGHTSVGR